MSNKTITVGIVGGGRVGVSFAKILGQKQNVSVTGIVTSTPKRQRELNEQLGVEAFGTIDEMLEKDNKPQIVCVVNANDAHAEATLKALEADCHVYLEKPMAPTLEECVRIVEAEKRSKGQLQVGFEYIHGTMTGRVRALLREGYFGEPL
ncbi:MAG: hypothetical protein GF344_15915, partial [Chitinivibrionales bacterium]|nr:hypothetical protein [Chitinivibrionales bacterium]MBD3358184.1 hypothetical protein [Chitinivibrionales bacterium]